MSRKTTLKKRTYLLKEIAVYSNNISPTIEGPSINTSMVLIQTYDGSNHKCYFIWKCAI